MTMLLHTPLATAILLALLVIGIIAVMIYALSSKGDVKIDLSLGNKRFHLEGKEKQGR